MSNEITYTVGLRIQKNNLKYLPAPVSFQVTMNGYGGPTPGGFLARTTGTVVSLAALNGQTPGPCWIKNYDLTNFVTFGIYDGISFHPVLEIGPGEEYPVKLSRYIGQEFEDTGTGTNADVNQLMVFADTADCEVSVEAFPR